MKNYLNQILRDLGSLIYQYLWASVIISMLIIVFLNYSKKYGVDTVIKELIDSLRDTQGAKRFFAILYLVFLLQRTIFNRGPWGNPLSNPVGDWFLFIDKNTINFDIIENIILFIPLSTALNWLNSNRLLNSISFKFILAVSFMLSCSIEIFQLLFRVGTFQLSDIFFNTVGGLFGFLLYKGFLFFYSLHTNILKSKF